MNIKTLTGRSIHAALAEARRRFGDDVMLVRSAAPSGEEPARVTVLIDEPVETATAEEKAGAQPAGAERGYQQVQQRARERVAAAENAAGVREVVSGGRFDHVEDSPVTTAPLGPTEQQNGRAQDAERRRRGRLFPSDPTQQNGGDTPDGSGRQLEGQLQTLHDRLLALEERMGERFIGHSFHWMSHPLYAQLLRRGMKPTTAAGLFNALSDQAYGPDADEETIAWALAQEVLRRLNEAAASRRNVGPKLVLGPSGSGKTSLLLKMATHESFFATRRPTVILLNPKGMEGPAHYEQMDVFRRFGVPVQRVRTREEMARALERASAFDQLLIDTPSLPMRPQASRQFARQVQQLVADIVPLEVQLVLNATRAFDEFEHAILEDLPLQPQTMALTHLDEVVGWGRVAEWLLSVRLPVQEVSIGPAIPDHIMAFSPTRFVEAFLELQ